MKVPQEIRRSRVQIKLIEYLYLLGLLWIHAKQLCSCGFIWLINNYIVFLNF